MRKYQIGDFVRVTEPGETYDSYDEIFKELGFVNKKTNPSFDSGTPAQIFGMTSHPRTGETMLALVDSEGKECLICEDGVEPLSYQRKKQNTVFGITGSHDAVVLEDGIKVGCQFVSKEKFKELQDLTEKVWG
jgi:hypothetical protein